MTIWASLPTDRILADLEEQAMFDQHRKAWTDRKERALNRALEDRTRLQIALRDLLTTLQVEYPSVSMRMLQAEARAVQALEGLAEVDPAVAS